MIVFDEKKYAEKMLKKGFFTKNKNVYELHILAKYYFYIGKTKDEVKELLTKFCNKYVEYFNMDEWYGVINRTISTASRGNLVTDKHVDITKSELDTIQTLKDIREQKLAFALLVLYKFYNYKRFKVTLEDLFNISDLLSYNSETRLRLLHSLTSQGIIDIDMRGRRWVSFSEKESESFIIRIKDFDCFIYEYYLFLKLDGFMSCTNCNKATVYYYNKQYCPNCKDEIRKETWRKSKSKSRKSLSTGL
ncbi:hypothetical protein M3649_04085 [Ureibacillus chungkukjangi]|uniref:hypothetical protein n=1 Tax=Ureibacillus chungkukjangi TaxID=1202712 RepID=UPI00203EE73D|nr:hypothetical protein [Ureibacillus chungkukjangi]MCM3387312.1 hypothetical protein [Ureibacillus chungkukjangi]